MIRPIRSLFPVAAGLGALVCAASSAVAHEGPAPPRPARPAQPALITGEPGPYASSGIHSLRDLADGRRPVVLGRVSRTDTYDAEKLLVYRLAVERVLRGPALGPSVSIVDIRAGLPRPPLLADGQRAVVILEAAPSLSYLKQQLPGETSLFQLAHRRDGLIPITDESQVDSVVTALDAADRVRDATDDETRTQLRRTLAFQLLASGQPRLVADGLLELRRLPSALELTSEDVSTLGRVLRDTTIPAPTRIGLIRLLGQRRWNGAAAALEAVAVDQPDVLAALLAARADLGTPVTRRELAPYLASEDPAVQAAAVTALARSSDPAALDELGRFAVAGGDPAVRESAIKALGESKRPEAARYLRQTFASPDPALMQASGRALLELDEAAGNAAFTDLALTGQTADVRRYAALLLVMTRGRDSRAVQQLLARNPDPEVRRVLEHGIELRDVHHQHGD
ncbi:MAG TPA: HEAT repeat domain-containing protein [Candidatus Limnocylindria bacterium]|nr:HEAT repeat domain-containing protein [Candidatus Limnocylindria bacterium]